MDGEIDDSGKPNGNAPGATPKISKLGQRLREISDEALASGTERLSLDEIHRVISEARGGTT